MNETRFALQPHLDMLDSTRRPRFSLRARAVSEFQEWQSEFRAELARVLGLTGRARVPVVTEQVGVKDCGLYLEEKYALDVGDEVLAPIYVLVPKREPPFQTILVFHGHDPSVQAILGHYEDKETEDENRAHDNNYAQLLAEAGYLVCAVEQRGFGERLTNQTMSGPFRRSCRHLAFEYMLQGRTLLGERVWDGMCALNYLQTRADSASNGFGCTGHSGGGTTALFLTALDTRIHAAVVSGYFCSFRDSILGMEHCECNYVPGILELGEMGDIAALVAPRALGIVNGAQDPIFPVGATRVQYETVKRAYDLHQRAEACTLYIHPGAHRYDFASSRAWFERTLARESSC